MCFDVTRAFQDHVMQARNCTSASLLRSRRYDVVFDSTEDDPDWPVANALMQCACMGFQLARRINGCKDELISMP